MKKKIIQILRPNTASMLQLHSYKVYCCNRWTDQGKVATKLVYFAHPVRRKLTAGEYDSRSVHRLCIDLTKHAIQNAPVVPKDSCFADS